MIDITVLQSGHDWQTWAQPLMSGGVMACILASLYMWQENRKRVGYAKMLVLELGEIRRAAEPFSLRGAEMPTVQPGNLSREAYDSLLSSSCIAYFDVNLQLRLRRFYSDMDDHRYDRLRQRIDSLRTDVNNVADSRWTDPLRMYLKRAFGAGR